MTRGTCGDGNDDLIGGDGIDVIDRRARQRHYALLGKFYDTSSWNPCGGSDVFRGQIASIYARIHQRLECRR